MLQLFFSSKLVLYRHILLKTSSRVRIYNDRKGQRALVCEAKGGNDLEVIFAVSEHILIAELLGELDHHAAEHVREDIDDAVRENSASCLILDFSKVRYMDSSGIGVVLGRYRKLSASGGEVVIASCSETVKNILNMAGIFSLMQYADTKEEAVTYFRGKEVL